MYEIAEIGRNDLSLFIFIKRVTNKTLKALYIRFPSFQISPELSISLTTDTTVDFNGTLQADYCGTDKLLYEIFWADDDDED